LGEWFATRDSHPINTIKPENMIGKLTRMYLAGRRKRPGSPVKTSAAVQWTALHPDNGPHARTIHGRPCEKTRKVEFVPDSAYGVVGLLNHHFFRLSLWQKNNSGVGDRCIL